MAGKESRYWKLCIQLWLFIQLSNESTLVTKLFFFFFLFYKIQIDPEIYCIQDFFFIIFIIIFSEIKNFFSLISSLLSLLKFCLFRIIYEVKDFFQFCLQYLILILLITIYFYIKCFRTCFFFNFLLLEFFSYQI
jgi:hypothetical protein